MRTAIIVNRNIERMKPQYMTSLEIAEVTGKQHYHIMEAIRKMEPAWKKIAASNFRLGTYKDANGQLRPCYQLTKTECLYIATKFNDEARAKLVLRWEELERSQMEETDANLLPLKELKLLAEKADYCDEVLQSVDCVSTTQVAKEMGMTAQELYRWLVALGIVYWQSGEYMLYANYARMHLAKTRTHGFRNRYGRMHTERYLVWTEEGRKFLHEVMKA